MTVNTVYLAWVSWDDYDRDDDLIGAFVAEDVALAAAQDFADRKSREYHSGQGQPYVTDYEVLTAPREMVTTHEFTFRDAQTPRALRGLEPKTREIFCAPREATLREHSWYRNEEFVYPGLEGFLDGTDTLTITESRDPAGDYWDFAVRGLDQAQVQAIADIVVATWTSPDYTTPTG